MCYGDPALCLAFSARESRRFVFQSRYPVHKTLTSALCLGESEEDGQLLESVEKWWQRQFVEGSCITKTYGFYPLNEEDYEKRDSHKHTCTRSRL